MSAASAAAAAAAVLCALLCGALVSSADPVDGSPTARAGFGGQCTTKADCTTVNSECISGRCACNASDIKVGNRCLLPVGGRCETRECDADNSHCVSYSCVCKDNFIQTYNNTYCYEVPNDYNEYCEKDHDCRFLTEHGRCKGGKCRCSDTTALHENKQCLRKIDELGAHCIKETEVCYLERDKDNQKVECKDSICRCKEGTKPSKDNLSCGGAGALQAMSFAASVLALVVAKALA